MAKKILTHYDYTTDPNSPMMHYIQGLEYIDSGDKDNPEKCGKTQFFNTIKC